MGISMRVVDLSFAIQPHFRWAATSERRSTHERGGLFQSTVATLGCHAFTHVDAPVHFLPGDRDIAQMPIDQWMGPAAVVDLTHLGENGEVTAADLARVADHVAQGDIALLRTDWPRRVDVGSPRFWSHAPYTGRDACEWLVGRGVKAVGYDYPPDHAIRTTIFQPATPVSRRECTTHDVFFPAGITVIEYLTNLDQIGAMRCQFIALPLRLEGADGSPVRAVAIVD
jgi:kynurenine formamidase